MVEKGERGERGEHFQRSDSSERGEKGERGEIFQRSDRGRGVREVEKLREVIEGVYIEV